MKEMKKNLEELKKDMAEFEKKLEKAWAEENDIKIKEYREKLEAITDLVFKLKSDN
ncbi:hypothetical protein PM10SUCC1_13450 [Propionigenium maris DSM 9537]|uniref:Uncharacterized protein n=1 Tax=Propionigenium maris DSM 9537 TaxID=1123000 RepID=A0A9W6LM04_9FUSO|nr:hypothetical protein [Propionigenium maris]GLI55831.1 hypothetical protein PM10SUCC1_13450 [Propionigenium maris DSM 9537]